MSDQPNEVPLVEQLLGVPIGAVAEFEVSRFHHRHIPYGNLCNKAGLRIRELEAENERLREALLEAYAAAWDVKPRATTVRTRYQSGKEYAAAMVKELGGKGAGPDS